MVIVLFGRYDVPWLREKSLLSHTKYVIRSGNHPIRYGLSFSFERFCLPSAGARCMKWKWSLYLYYGAYGIYLPVHLLDLLGLSENMVPSHSIQWSLIMFPKAAINSGRLSIFRPHPNQFFVGNTWTCLLVKRFTVNVRFLREIPMPWLPG